MNHNPHTAFEPFALKMTNMKSAKPKSFSNFAQVIRTQTQSF